MGGLDVLINNGELSQHAAFAVAGLLMLVNSICYMHLCSGHRWVASPLSSVCGTADHYVARLLTGAGSCCSDLGVEHYGMADEIEFLENYKTHVASAVIMMQVAQPPQLITCTQYFHAWILCISCSFCHKVTGASWLCSLFITNIFPTTITAFM